MDGDGFGPENLPYGVARLSAGPTVCVCALGDHVLDLSALNRLFRLGVPEEALQATSLNRFLACGRAAREDVRWRLHELLLDGNLPDEVRVAPSSVRLLTPVDVGDFVDFSASLHHAVNMSRLLRPGTDGVSEHWRRLPVAYQGRAGSIVVSGTPVRRPAGQVAGGRLQATGALDFEAEVGFVIGVGNALGEPVPADEVREHVAGLLLVNDWSARDLQAYESRPLGPFTAKSFATSVSPWLVTLDALERYRVPAPVQEPAPAGYLTVKGDWAYDIRLEVLLQSETMRREGIDPVAVSNSTFAGHYWTIPQMLAHATVSGARIRPGDLFGSGAVSGPDPGSYGSLSELAWGGDRPVALPDGTQRAYLHDGDTVILRGSAGGEGRPSISLGEVSGTVLPARRTEG